MRHKERTMTESSSAKMNEEFSPYWMWAIIIIVAALMVG
jgi:hypothetical protein